MKRRDLSVKDIKNVILVAFLIFTASMTGAFSGYFYAGQAKEEVSEARYSAEVEEFIDEYNRVVNEFYVEVDKDVLIKGAIKGMLEALGDDHSIFLDEEDNYQFQQRVKGYYQGIGVGLMDKEAGIVITAVFDNSPAKKAGIQINDVIIKLDDQDFTEKLTQDVVNYIRETEDKKVKVTVLRNEKEKSFDVDIETVTLPSVESEVLEAEGMKIGYIKVSVFAGNTYAQFLTHLEETEAKTDGLIIDLRNNSGGYLSTTEEMISLFFNKDKVIYQTEERGKVTKVYSRGNKDKKYPIVMLGNEASASASEIMIAAMQEAYGAPFVGMTTYGKGTVQELIDLDDNDAFKFTARKWLTPDGNWINDIGIEPDYEVNDSEDFYPDMEKEKDLQLKKAIEVFLEL